jgi:hypothetical protein
LTFLAGGGLKILLIGQKITARAMPMPIPAFAPVLKPLPEESGFDPELPVLEEVPLVVVPVPP